MKVNTHPTNPGLKPIKSNATKLFEQVTVDFITHLPVSNRFDLIMVVVDHGLLKGVIYVAYMSNRRGPMSKMVIFEEGEDVGV
jgi:hypothetical protein